MLSIEIKSHRWVYGFSRGGSDQVFSLLEWKIEKEHKRLILLSLTMCSVGYLIVVVELSSEYRISFTRLGIYPLAPISQGIRWQVKPFLEISLFRLWYLSLL